MGKKLYSQAKKSDLMDIEIEYNGKVYSFNLYQETAIDEENLNWEIKKHSPSSAFLGMLLAKCKKQAKIIEAKRKKAFNEEYDKYKQEVNKSTNRAYSNDYARIKAEKSTAYRIANKQLQRVEHNIDVLEICLKAMSDKKDLLQSLSANVRKQL